MTLLGTGPCTTERLAANIRRHGRGPANGTSFSEHALDQQLAHLRKLGLLTLSDSRPEAREHVPVEPSIALESMAHLRTAEVQRAHLAA
ncbi:hypothetical protein GTW69_44340, partial [Streptomyces sp. SID7760]|nr:hypothetical protein [Streptomyces sp. SID7760]